MAMVIDRKTGRKRRADPKRSRAAAKGARKRKGKHLTAATKRKIALGEKKTARTGRTKTGRRVLKKTGSASAVASKVKRVKKAAAGVKRAAKVGKTKTEKLVPYKRTKLTKAIGMSVAKGVMAKRKKTTEKKNKGTIDGIATGLGKKPVKEMVKTKTKGSKLAKGTKKLARPEAKPKVLKTAKASPKVKMPTKRSVKPEGVTMTVKRRKGK
jgi:hypothetical protein